MDLLAQPEDGERKENENANQKSDERLGDSTDEKIQGGKAF